MELQPEWNEFLALLSHHGVRFVMVGGLAVAVHGHERYTKDLDVLVDSSEANARRLGKALAEFGFKAHGRAWRRFTEPYRILTIGVEPLRIDVLTGISGVAFDAVWKGRVEAKTSAGTIPVIGLVELRANKVASGRPEDLRDVEKLDEIERAKKKAIRAGGRNRSKRPRRAAPRSRTRGKGARRTKRRA